MKLRNCCLTTVLTSTIVMQKGPSFMRSSIKNNLVLLEEILKRGANPNTPCQFEQLGYPLHFALSLQRTDAILLLQKYNADVNIVDPQGRTITQLLQLYNDPKLNEILQHDK